MECQLINGMYKSRWSLNIMVRITSQKYLTKKRERRVARQRSRALVGEAPGDVDASSDPTASDPESEHVTTLHTFPTSTKTKVIHQSNDLTCGMRALQNMYGRHFVTRNGMDACAIALEKRSFGVEMYDKRLGYYNVEVLISALQSKGKCVQQIDADKIPSAYFHAAIASNPVFSGYIVTLDTGGVNHYVTIRQSASGHLRLFDSLPGSKAVRIKRERLFTRDARGALLMCHLDVRPVVAILAVGNAPFLAYTLMHDTWSEDPPSPNQYMSAIQKALCSWKDGPRLPDASVYERLKDVVADQVSHNVSLVVKYESKDTTVQCHNVESLLAQLVDLGYIHQDRAFFLKQDGRILRSHNGAELNADAVGSFDDYGVDLHRTVELIQPPSSNQVQVGGFYRFESSVSGTCVGVQHNAYSVRDENGTVHIVYKSGIDHIEQIKR
jgi:hypothetical protein